MIDLLHGYFDVKTEDDARKRREKITGRVLALDRSLEDTLPYLCALLGLTEEKGPLAQMDAQIRRRRTLDAIKRLLVRESLKQPLMVVFEDLHWIDDETQALLDLLADSIATARVLLADRQRDGTIVASTGNPHVRRPRLSAFRSFRCGCRSWRNFIRLAI